MEHQGPTVNEAPASPLTREEKMKLAREALVSGETQDKFAEQHGIKPSTLGYWIKQLREDSKKVAAKETVTTAFKNKSVLTQDQENALRAQIEALTVQRDELMGKLQDANLKIKSMHAILYVVGHQLGDE